MSRGEGRLLFPANVKPNVFAWMHLGQTLLFFITSCLNGQRGAFRERILGRHFQLQSQLQKSYTCDGDNTELWSGFSCRAHKDLN